MTHIATVEKTQALIGEQPFDCKWLETIVENDNTSVEVVRLDGRKALRKSKYISDWQVAKLQKREVDFLTEADHPALCKVYGLFEGVVDGKMVSTVLREYIEGDTLEKIVEKGGALQPPRAVKYVSGALAALQYIHSKNFLHRDFKPSNIMVERSERESWRRYDGPREEKIKLADLDSLGKASASLGTGGSSWGVGTQGWTHPYQFDPNLSSVQTDLFAVGTTLYYCLMGRQAETTNDPDGGIALAENDLAALENKIGCLDGGPELVRTVRRLFAPRRDEQYDSAQEVIGELDEIISIFDAGYEAVDKHFRVYQESPFKGWAQKARAGVSWMVDSPLKIGIAAGLVLSPAGYWVTSNVMQAESAGRAIFYAPELAEDAPAVVQVSAGINDVSNKLGELYVKMASGEGVGTDVVLMRELQDVAADAKATIAKMTFVRKQMEPFKGPIGSIRRGGTHIKQSFKHRAVDHDYEDCSTDSDGNESCTSYYDYSEHWWNFMLSTANKGWAKLHRGLAALAEVPVTTIPMREYRQESSSVDALGRPVDFAKTGGRGQNEWIDKGLVVSYNNVNHPPVVLQDRHIREFAADQEKGLLGMTRKYKPKHYVKNECPKARSGCDEKGAPAGYVLTKRVGAVTAAYGNQLNRVNVVMNRAESKLNEVESFAGSLAAGLNTGKKVTAQDLLEVSDLAVQAYKHMVPGSLVAPPTIAEQQNYPLFAGGGLLLLPGLIGLGFQIYQSRQGRWGRRGFGGYSSFGSRGLGSGFGSSRRGSGTRGGSGFGGRSRRRRRRW